MSDALKPDPAVLAQMQGAPKGFYLLGFQDAVKAAAAQPQQAPLKERPDFVAGYDAGLTDGRCIAEREQAAQPVAWCDDGALAGGVGSVASAATKQYWARGDRVDRETAARLKHPLFAAAQPQQATDNPQENPQ